MSRRTLIVVAVALGLCAALLGLGVALRESPLTRLRADAEGRHGSWYFPRGGPDILGYDSPAVSELIVDGQRVAVGPGRVAKRVVFAPGIHAVTFRGPADARLLWHPPGRRGALEYVPASSLSPLPPQKARFGGGAGASRTDAAIATAILLVLAGAGLAIARPRPSRLAMIVGTLVFVVALAVRLWGLARFGQTWDEDEYWSSGRNYLVNLLSLDFRDASWRWNYEHPPVTKYIAGVGALWQDGYGVARALFCVLGALTCVLAAAIAARLFRGEDGKDDVRAWRVGALAGLGCALLPHLVGHARIVGHETTSVFFWTLAVWLALGAVDDDGRPTWRGLAWTGVALGLAVATRFANLLLAPVVGVALLVAARGLAGRVRMAWMGALVVPAAGAATFWAVWPRMWLSPLRHLDEAWEKLRLPHSLEPYLGVYTVTPPWHYFLVYVLATTPVVLLACLALGAWRGAARRELGWLVLLAWLVAPFGIGWSPVRQDGVRYVLPVLVPLAIAAAAGLDQLLRVLEPRVRLAVPALALALVAYLGVTWAGSTPYEIDHYNEVIGGADRAQRDRLFEVGWWGEGIGEAVDYVNAHAQPGDTLYKQLVPNHLNWFSEPLWRGEVQSPAQATWLVVNDAAFVGRGAFKPPSDATLVKEVRAGGASLVRVYKRQVAQ